MGKTATRLLALLPLLLLLAACPKDEVISKTFVDKFDRAEIGTRYLNTGASYRIVDGRLNVQGAYNHPLWLKAKLPRNAIVEVDVMSKSATGDIKLEVWGDGQSHATRKGAYLATSYVFIFGGWGNRISALCRMDEHSDDRKTRRGPRVVPGKTYHFKIKRQGNKVEWFIDGKAFLAMDDSSPLEGARHSYLGFNNWQSNVFFDNLKITPLK